MRAWLCLFSLISLVASPLLTRAEDYCLLAKDALVQATRIRGLKVKSSVPCLVHRKEQVRTYLLNTISTKITEKKLLLEGTVYKTLGLVPDSYAYKDGLVELYLNQVGGYYDPEENHFVMAAWIPALFQTSVAVHELTHALQDQYFNLNEFTDQKLDNSDALLARSALVEGDANSVMLDQMYIMAGKPPLAKQPNVDSFLLQTTLGASLMASSNQVPHAMQMILLFPYTSGVRFAHSLLRQNGYESINQAFKNPPRSTEEILHPDKYGSVSKDFVSISDAEAAETFGLENQEVVFSDTIGEFVISTLLGEHLVNRQEAIEAAKGWGGDRLLCVNTDKGRFVYWRTEWDSPQDSQEFYDGFNKALAVRKKFPLHLQEQIFRDGKSVLITLRAPE